MKSSTICIVHQPDFIVGTERNRMRLARCYCGHRKKQDETGQMLLWAQKETGWDWPDVTVGTKETGWDWPGVIVGTERNRMRLARCYCGHRKKQDETGQMLLWAQKETGWDWPDVIVGTKRNRMRLAGWGARNEKYDK